MASNEENTFTPDTLPTGADGTDLAPDLPAGAAAPAKKAPAKRAPRKSTKKASAPKKAPIAASEATADGASDATSGVDGPAVAVTPTDAPPTPARKTAKRAPRKAAKKATAPALDLTEPAQVDRAPEPEPVSVPEPASHLDPVPGTGFVRPVPESVPESEHEPSPETEQAAGPSFGLLFQPPAPTKAPRRRRATAPAAAPAPEHSPTQQAAPDAASKDEEPRQDEVRQPRDGGQQDVAKTADESDDSSADDAPRRRRRGGKGRRGRGNADAGSDETSVSADGASDDKTSSDQPPADEGDQGESGESHRRTRRRRRGSAGDGDDQQQPSSGGTTTKVRAPRPPRDEVTSVKGSTRLEAKKQRRREGREAGRRRTVITEAEFLARRESVERVMVVRHKQDRTQIGVLEDGVLVEHYVSDETNSSMAGNVYLGRIQNVLPSMEAAFVDIGKGRNAVLYAGEVNWDAAGLDNRAKRIENALSSGQGVLVQVTKDPIGHKGARLTSQVSLPGRYLVYVPDGNMMGISRKLPDTERARLKKILRDVVPENAGVIVRTAAEGASEDELRADVTRLTAVWEGIQAKSKSANAPALLHGESDLTVRVIRDVFNEDFSTLVASGDPAWQTVNDYVSTVAPDLADRVQKWTGEQDLFTHYRVDEQIAKAMDRKVWLPSGGTLVIDRTEAMTVVDVNTGKFVGSGGNLEETVTKNNIEAAEEVVRQLRLRDIGGIIVIDFIDMVLESNRDLVVRRLLECLGRDRTKHQVAEVTSLGLVQMTRKRVGAGLIEVFSQDCEHCNGRGIIVSADPIDRSAGGDGSGGNSGNSGNSGSDGGSGRGTRGRRARGTGRDNNTTVAAVPEPKAPTSGPTPAQIAAAAHAAAVQALAQSPATSSGEVARSGEVAPSGGVVPSGETGPSSETVPAGEVVPSGEVGRSDEAVTSREGAPSGEAVTSAEVASSGEAARVSEAAATAEVLNSGPGQADQPRDVPGGVVAPARSRRRSSRSAKSPAIAVAPSAAVGDGASSADAARSGGGAPSGDAARSGAAAPVGEVASSGEVQHLSQGQADQPSDVPVEIAPVRSRRRSSRSAKSPAISVVPSAAPIDQPVAVERPPVEPSTPPATSASNAEPGAVAESAPVPEVAPVTAPAARGRRKRPRVMSPAGPPSGAGQPDADGGEFGS